MTTNQEKNKTPKWLRRLEKESWQAELLISGIALFAALQLPEFVYWLSDTLINFLPTKYYLAGYAISFFYLFGISILTTFFIIHFILRAYWVGLIGLNSVYPNGYKTKDGFYSDYFSGKMADMLPDVKDTIKAIDEQCSGMFSGAFVFMMMYGMMSITFSILLVIYMLTNEFIPTILWKILAGLFLILTIIVGAFGMASKVEKFRNNDKLQNRFFTFNKIYGNIITPFVFKPLNQIIFTYQSNAKNASSSVKVMLPFIIIASLLSGLYLSKSNIGFMIGKGTGEAVNMHANTIYGNHYLDQYKEDQKIFVPVIDSDIIDGPYAKLFVPLLRNERYIHNEVCGEYEEDESIEGDSARIIKRQFYLDCYHKYIQVNINDQSYHPEFFVHDHKQEGRRGVLSYIPKEKLKIGKNTITVNKMKNTAQELYETYSIHFWYSND